VDKQRSAAISSVMKLPVIAGVTQAEGVALGAFVTSGDGVKAIPDLNLGIHGILLDDGASQTPMLQVPLPPALQPSGCLACAPASLLGNRPGVLRMPGSTSMLHA
jgi:hypothetical protein